MILQCKIICLGRIFKPHLIIIMNAPAVFDNIKNYLKSSFTSAVSIFIPGPIVVEIVMLFK